MDLESLEDVFEERAKEDNNNTRHSEQSDGDASRDDNSDSWTRCSLRYHHVRVSALEMLSAGKHRAASRLLGFYILDTSSRSLSSRDPTFVQQRLRSL